MDNIKISELNELETRHKEDLLAIVDTNNNETKKIKVETLAPENFELYAIADTQPTIPVGESYYNTTSNKIFTNVGGVYVDKGEPKKGILYIIYSSQTVYVYNNTTLVNIGGSSSYSDLGNKPSINGNILNGNKTNTDLGIPNALNENSDSTQDGYSCDYVNKALKDVYSTTETKTNKIWTDGKPIYRKVVPIQSLGNNERIQVAHNISNIKQVTNTTLTYYDSVDGGWYNTRFNGNNMQVSINIYYITSTNIIINCYGDDWRNRTNNIYAILEYTKTTD